MSFLSGLVHAGGDVASPLLHAAGNVSSALGDKTGGQRLNGIATAIASPNQVLSNASSLFNPNTSSFTTVKSPAQAGGAAGGAQAAPIDQSGAYSGGYGSGGTSSNIDPNTGLSYDYLESQANGQLANLGQQASVGNQNILDAYNASYNALTGSKAIADRNYNTSKDQTLQDYTTARGNEQAQVGQQNNALQRLLSAHGYQGSANQAASYATALAGAKANSALQQGFGRNQQALDTNYGDYNNQFNTQVGSLGHQKDVQQKALQAQVDGNKQSLLQQLSQIAQARTGNAAAGAQYQPQIDQLGQQITQLGQQYASPVIQATAPVYQAPNLEAYTTPQQAAPTVQQPGAAGNVNPYLSVLLGQQDKKNQLAGV